MSETDLIKRLQIAASKTQSRLFRNNVGQGWVGKSVHVRGRTTVTLDDGDVVIKNARPLHSGLCVGSSDLIGWHPLVVTPEHIGSRLAIFTAVEGKFGRGQTTKEQAAFLHTVRASGGHGIIARSVDDLSLLDGFSGVRGESD